MAWNIATPPDDGGADAASLREAFERDDVTVFPPEGVPATQVVEIASRQRVLYPALTATGERVWRFWKIPAPGEPGSETWGPDEIREWGGAATWLSGTFDPGLNTLYWTTGNPWPDFNGGVRYYGALNRASSRTFKDNIEALSSPEAFEIFAQLQPKKFTLKILSRWSYSVFINCAK